MPIIQPFVRNFHITEGVVVYPYVLDSVTGTVLFGLVYYDLFNEFIEKRNCFQLGNNKGRRGYVSPVGLSP